MEGTNTYTNFGQLSRKMKFELKYDEPERGEIFLIDLTDIDLGTTNVLEKRRPGIILSRNEGNRSSSIVVVAFLTTTEQKRRYRMHYKFDLNGRQTTIKTEQVRTIDKERLIDRLGKVTPEQLKEVEKCVMYTLDLNRFSLENVNDIDTISVINKRTKEGNEILYEIEIQFLDQEPKISTINLETLKKFDKTITEDIAFDELKKRLDCCRGLNFLFNNIII